MIDVSNAGDVGGRIDVMNVIEVMDGLVPVIEFPRVTSEMPLKDGIRIMTHRLGLTAKKVREAAADRYPVPGTAHESGNLGRFKIRCFLRSDIIFSDILHVGYKELRFLGIGRRYLVNRILRAVLAGLCDAFDRSGKAGDFPPRSWMTADAAEKVRKVQEHCLYAMKNEYGGNLKSLKVRLTRIATPVLLELEANVRGIRTEVGKAARGGCLTGLKRFSELLIGYRKSLYRRTRIEDIRNKQKADRKKARRSYLLYATPLYYNGRKRLEKAARRRAKHEGYILLSRSLNDLRKRLNPEIPSWYRRPTDEDWKEGLTEHGRKPRMFDRQEVFARYGLGDVPGLSGDIDESEWWNLKTDWTVEEVRKRLKKKNEIPS